jgi:hypothetical protein
MPMSNLIRIKFIRKKKEWNFSFGREKARNRRKIVWYSLFCGNKVGWKGTKSGWITFLGVVDVFLEKKYRWVISQEKR